MSKSYDIIEPKQVRDAVMSKLSATSIRQRVETCPDYNPYFDKKDLATADRMDAAADAVLALPQAPEAGVGGEIVPTPDANKMGLTLMHKTPDRINLDASISRATLADDNGVLAQALDTAESLQAQDSAEKMLCHQLPTLHRAAMEMMQRAGNTPDVDRACKLANTAARLFETYQKGMTAISNYRRGGAQVVRHVHQYVQVQEGGKAIVTGGTGLPGGESEK